MLVTVPVTEKTSTEYLNASQEEVTMTSSSTKATTSSYTDPTTSIAGDEATAKMELNSQSNPKTSNHKREHEYTRCEWRFGFRHDTS
jgi:hypothetical protein